jgi:hypothetical protein
MPRPRKPGALNSVERATLSRQRRQVRQVGLPADAIADAEAIRERDGDPTRLAAIVRVLRKAAQEAP